MYTINELLSLLRAMNIILSAESAITKKNDGEMIILLI